MNNYKTVDEYMQGVPKNFAPKIKEFRKLARALVPKGKETIKYGMPTIEFGGKNLIHYAAMKGHLGFYPAPSGVDFAKAELIKKGIDYSKGCIRFAYDKPLPVALVKKIVKFRVGEEGISR